MSRDFRSFFQPDRPEPPARPSTSGNIRRTASHHRHRYTNKRKRASQDNMSDQTGKRANFSAISSNGINRNLNILNLKPAPTKKLVIKNLKSMRFCCVRERQSVT